jgi:two-component sensor histidine kinase
MQYRREKGDLAMVAGIGWNAGVVGQARFGIDMQSLPGRCYQTREAVMTGNVREDPDFRLSPVLEHHGIISALNAPIAFDGTVWGVIELDSTEPDRFTDDDRRFLLAFASILALTIRLRQAQGERERSGEELARRVAQADTLLSEQNHRVRNYFQTILAIIASRARRAKSEQIRSDYQDVMERVTAVALAHDQLTIGRDGRTQVDAQTYLEALCSGLERSAGGEFSIARDLAPVQLRPERAVPLGLVLNELLTNAIKYAVPGKDHAILSVQLAADRARSTALLAVRDNGPGMGEPRPGSQGLKLVRSLAAQLSGWIEIDSSASGTSVTLEFPLVE